MSQILNFDSKKLMGNNIRHCLEKHINRAKNENIFIYFLK